MYYIVYACGYIFYVQIKFNWKDIWQLLQSHSLRAGTVLIPFHALPTAPPSPPYIPLNPHTALNWYSVVAHACKHTHTSGLNSTKFDFCTKSHENFQSH